MNWFTFSAQIVNFLILVGLLKRFLYGPIVRAMDKREAGIRDRLQEAEDARHEAEEEAQTYRKKHEELDAKRRELLDEAREKADAERRERTRKAREEADALAAEWRREAVRERDAFLDDVRAQLADELMALARKTLHDLADADLERQIVSVFQQKLGAMDEDQHRALADAAREAGGSLTVSSGFELDEKLRNALAEQLRERWETDIEVRFETSDDLVAGIVLQADGQRLAWSVEAYLDAARERLADALARETETRNDEQDDQSEDDAE